MAMWRVSHADPIARHDPPNCANCAKLQMIVHYAGTDRCVLGMTQALSCALGTHDEEIVNSIKVQLQRCVTACACYQIMRQIMTKQVFYNDPMTIALLLTS